MNEFTLQSTINNVSPFHSFDCRGNKHLGSFNLPCKLSTQIHIKVLVYLFSWCTFYIPDVNPLSNISLVFFFQICGILLHLIDSFFHWEKKSSIISHPICLLLTLFSDLTEYYLENSYIGYSAFLILPTFSSVTFWVSGVTLSVWISLEFVFM